MKLTFLILTTFISGGLFAQENKAPRENDALPKGLTEAEKLTMSEYYQNYHSTNLNTFSAVPSE